MEDACKVAISTTGFAPSERPDLAILTSKLGGVYLGELRGGQTTHLVCKSIVEAVGSLKYVKALEWGAKVVAHEWLVQSAALGRALPVAGFKTDRSRGPLRDVTNLSEVRGKVSSTRGAAGPLAASVTATAHATTPQQQAAARTPVNKARATQPRAKLASPSPLPIHRQPLHMHRLAWQVQTTDQDRCATTDCMRQQPAWLRHGQVPSQVASRAAAGGTGQLEGPVTGVESDAVLQTAGAAGTGPSFASPAGCSSALPPAQTWTGFSHHRPGQQLRQPVPCLQTLAHPVAPRTQAGTEEQSQHHLQHTYPVAPAACTPPPQPLPSFDWSVAAVQNPVPAPHLAPSTSGSCNPAAFSGTPSAQLPHDQAPWPRPLHQAPAPPSPPGCHRPVVPSPGRLSPTAGTCQLALAGSCQVLPGTVPGPDSPDLLWLTRMAANLQDPHHPPLPGAAWAASIPAAGTGEETACCASAMAEWAAQPGVRGSAAAGMEQEERERDGSLGEPWVQGLVGVVCHQAAESVTLGARHTLTAGGREELLTATADSCAIHSGQAASGISRAHHPVSYPGSVPQIQLQLKQTKQIKQTKQTKEGTAPEPVSELGPPAAAGMHSSLQLQLAAGRLEVLQACEEASVGPPWGTAAAGDLGWLARATAAVGSAASPHAGGIAGLSAAAAVSAAAAAGAMAAPCAGDGVGLSQSCSHPALAPPAAQDMEVSPAAEQVGTAYAAVARAGAAEAEPAPLPGCCQVSGAEEDQQAMPDWTEVQGAGGCMGYNSAAVDPSCCTEAVPMQLSPALAPATQQRLAPQGLLEGPPSPHAFAAMQLSPAWRSGSPSHAPQCPSPQPRPSHPPHAPDQVLAAGLEQPSSSPPSLRSSGAPPADIQGTPEGGRLPGPGRVLDERPGLGDTAMSSSQAKGPAPTQGVHPDLVQALHFHLGSVTSWDTTPDTSPLALPASPADPTPTAAHLPSSPPATPASTAASHAPAATRAVTSSCIQGAGCHPAESQQDSARSRQPAGPGAAVVEMQRVESNLDLTRSRQPAGQAAAAVGAMRAGSKRSFAVRSIQKPSAAARRAGPIPSTAAAAASPQQSDCVRGNAGAAAGSPASPHPYPYPYPFPTPANDSHITIRRRRQPSKSGAVALALAPPSFPPAPPASSQASVTAPAAAAAAKPERARAAAAAVVAVASPGASVGCGDEGAQGELLGRAACSGVQPLRLQLYAAFGEPAQRKQAISQGHTFSAGPTQAVRLGDSRQVAACSAVSRAGAGAAARAAKAAGAGVAAGGAAGAAAGQGVSRSSAAAPTSSCSIACRRPPTVRPAADVSTGSVWQRQEHGWVAAGCSAAPAPSTSSMHCRRLSPSHPLPPPHPTRSGEQGDKPGVGAPATSTRTACDGCSSGDEANSGPPPALCPTSHITVRRTRGKLRGTRPAPDLPPTPNSQEGLQGGLMVRLPAEAWGGKLEQGSGSQARAGQGPEVTPMSGNRPEDLQLGVEEEQEVEVEGQSWGLGGKRGVGGVGEGVEGQTPAGWQAVQDLGGQVGSIGASCAPNCWPHSPSCSSLGLQGSQSVATRPTNTSAKTAGAAAAGRAAGAGAVAATAGVAAAAKPAGGLSGRVVGAQQPSRVAVCPERGSSSPQPAVQLLQSPAPMQGATWDLGQAGHWLLQWKQRLETAAGGAVGGVVGAAAGCGVTHGVDTGAGAASGETVAPEVNHHLSPDQPLTDSTAALHLMPPASSTPQLAPAPAPPPGSRLQRWAATPLPTKSAQQQQGGDQGLAMNSQAPGCYSAAPQQQQSAGGRGRDPEPGGPQPSSSACGSTSTSVAMRMSCMPPRTTAQGVRVVRVRVRPPKATTVMQHHQLASLKAVAFADQVEVKAWGWAPISITCRDKARHIRCPVLLLPTQPTQPQCSSPTSHPTPGPCSSQPHPQALRGSSFPLQPGSLVVADPVCLYRLGDGEWWMEFGGLLSVHQVQQAMQGAQGWAGLPRHCCGLGNELFRDSQSFHCRLCDVVCDVHVSRSRRPPKAAAALQPTMLSRLLHHLSPPALPSGPQGQPPPSHSNVQPHAPHSSCAHQELQQQLPSQQQQQHSNTQEQAGPAPQQTGPQGQPLPHHSNTQQQGGQAQLPACLPAWPLGGSAPAWPGVDALQQQDVALQRLLSAVQLLELQQHHVLDRAAACVRPDPNLAAGGPAASETAAIGGCL